MNRSIVFYLVSRLALINGLALVIPMLLPGGGAKRGSAILLRPWRLP